MKRSKACGRILAVIKQAVRLNLPSIVTVRLVSVASPYSGQVTNLDQSRSF